uniref:Uncharacterized protein n=1 Tax=Panagrolaimus davidi TaxID=227884 RepID=A0A914P8D8_9BILA
MNNFFVNGEITIKVEGFLKAQRQTTSIISAPISLKWKNKEEDLKEALKTESKLCSKELNVASFSNVRYYLSLYTKQINSKNEEKTMLCLNTKRGKEKKIEAVYDFNINTFNF